MSTQSPTPRTDAMLETWELYWMRKEEKDRPWEWHDFARRLETELNEADARIKELEAALEEERLEVMSLLQMKEID